MPKFLFCGSYSTTGIKDVLKEGGTGGRAAWDKLVQGAGGRVEALYWAFGEDDLYCIAELPDTVAAGAISLAVAAGGATRIKTVLLETAEEVDEACKKSLALPYRQPGA